MDPAYPNRFRKEQPTIECAACHMQVMLRGDWQGWKPVGLPDGRQVWYCNKTPCQQQRDILMLQVQSGNIPSVLKAGQPGQLLDPAGVPKLDEVEAMKARIAQLEAELAEAKGQSTAPQEDRSEAPSPSEVPHQPASVQPPQYVHAEEDGKAICGAECAPEEMKVPEEMSFSDVVCERCIEVWTARQEGRKPQPTAEEALSAPAEPEPAPEAQSVPAPRMEALELPQPSSSLPHIEDYSVLPKFDRDLIARINDGAEPGGPILLTQATYPDIDFEKVKPGQLRKGISGFFTSMEVDAIDRVTVDGKLLGMVFTLKSAEP